MLGRSAVELTWWSVESPRWKKQNPGNRIYDFGFNSGTEVCGLVGTNEAYVDFERWNAGYDVYDYPDLWLKFANLIQFKGDLAAPILEFISEFGLLGNNPDITIEVTHPPQTNVENAVLVKEEGWIYAERLVDWEREIKRINKFIGMWNALKEGNRLEYFRFCRTVYNVPEIKDDAVSPGLEHHIDDLWISFGLDINEELKRRGINLEIKWADGRELGMYLAFVPKNLLSVIWNQFAEAVAGKFEIKRCVRCEQRFIGTGRNVRKDKQLCGNACKQALYRERKKVASP